MVCTDLRKPIKPKVEYLFYFDVKANKQNTHTNFGGNSSEKQSPRTSLPAAEADTPSAEAEQGVSTLEGALPDCLLCWETPETNQHVFRGENAEVHIFFYNSLTSGLCFPRTLRQITLDKPNFHSPLSLLSNLF